MTSDSPTAVSISSALAALEPLLDRSPTSSETGWAATLGKAGDAGIFVADYAGTSEWERHPHGDEIVLVLEGATTLFMLVDDEDVPHRLGPMEFVVVPQGVWHRFETPHRTQVMSVTPQPSDHSFERPTD